MMTLADQCNSKKLFSILLILSVFSANITFFSLPVLAYEKVMDKKIGVNKGYEKINSPEEFKQDKKEKQSYVEGEILVKYKNNKINLQTSKGRATALNFIRAKSLEKKEDLKRINTSVLRIKDGKTVEQKIAELKNDPNVEYAQPNFQYYPLSIDTNDTYKNNLWGLDNIGQTVNSVAGTSDADIDAPEAWAINEGANASIIVAVIDSGVAYNHPDLLNNMWDGSNCKDENGDVLGGCNHGYDYEDSDKTPLPTNSSHGTHIAGTIAALKNNGKGIIGVAPQAKIMVLKSSLTTDEIVKAISFAENNNARVINASWRGGSDTVDQALYEAIQNFDGLFIASAGNGGPDDIGDDNDLFPHYPSDYNLDNIISVTATDQNDAKASFSNYGAISVDVGAPGTNIYSTVADSNVMSENFEGADYQITTGGTTQDQWRIGNDGWSKVAYSDSYTPYDTNAFTWMMSKDIIDLSDNTIKGATLSFTVWCDTPSSAAFDDYILTQHFSNGDWSNSVMYNEDKIRSDGGFFWMDSGYDGYYKNYTENISDHLSSDFAFAFTWNTNPSIDNNLGCAIDDIKITKYSDGSDELYDYSQGTSMATPHVAGLAALVWGYKPELSYAEVKDTILTTGDNLASLSGKTVTGKRINSFNALNSLIPETHTISGTIKYYDGIKTVPNASVILENGVGAHIATTTTDINGFYQFTDVASGGDYVVMVEKNDNASGLTGADQGKIGRHIVQLELFDTIYKTIAGDVNNSGGLTGADQGKIGRFIVGLDSNLPSGAWKFYSSDAVLTAANYLTVDPTIVYTNLTANMSNQNFIGIKMGDVNNSWINN